MKMEKSEVVRVKALDYIKSHGLKQKWLAEQIGLCPSVLCRFLKGKRELYEESLDTLDKWLDGRL